MSKPLEEFRRLKNDKQRWEWLINNKDHSLCVMLDNDSTFLVDIEDYRVVDSVRFDSYLGWNDGVVDLLEALNIKCGCV